MLTIISYNKIIDKHNATEEAIIIKISKYCIVIFSSYLHHYLISTLKIFAIAISLLAKTIKC